MKVAVAGGGAVGTFIAGELRRAGHEVLVIEQDPGRVARMRDAGEPPGVTWHEADACEVDRLRAIGLADVDVVAAVTGDDEDNLVISLLAKQEFAVPRVVARVNNPKNEWMFGEAWGVDVAVSTPTCSPPCREAVSVGTLVRLRREGGRATLIEVTRPGQPGGRARIVELASPRLDRRGRAAATGSSSPRDTSLQVGDEVLCSSPPRASTGARHPHRR